MTRFLILSLIILIAGCSLQTPQLEPGEELVLGLWTAYEITSEAGTFETTVGAKGIDCPVYLVFHAGKWLIWAPGYWDVIKQPNGKGEIDE